MGRRHLLVGAMLLSLGGLVLGNEAVPDAQAMVYACAGCHAANDAFPRLGGMEPTRFLAAMKAFQTGSPSSTVMNRIAKGYSDADLAAMAAYFRAQTP